MFVLFVIVICNYMLYLYLSCLFKSNLLNSIFFSFSVQVSPEATKGGIRSVFFELNGVPREVRVLDKVSLSCNDCKRDLNDFSSF
jgi:hypothetical protein